MLKFIRDLFSFCVSIFAETDGSGSASRFVSVIIVASTMTVLIAATWFRHDLPTGDQLAGLAKVVGCGSVAYAANQIRRGLTEGSPSDNTPDAPDSPSVKGFANDNPK